MNSEKADDVNFTGLRTYAWLPSPALDSIKYFKFNKSISSSGLKEAVNNELQKRNYKIDNLNPDFFVQINTKFREQADTLLDTQTTTTDVQPRSSYYLYNPVNTTNVDPEYYNGYTIIAYIDNIRLSTYTEGAVYIDLLKKENDSTRIIWTGWAERALDEGEIKKDMIKDIHKVFEKEFPVKPTK